MLRTSILLGVYILSKVYAMHRRVDNGLEAAPVYCGLWTVCIQFMLFICVLYNVSIPVQLPPTTSQNRQTRLRPSTSSTFDHAKCQGTDWFYRRDRRLIEAHLYYLNLVQRSHCTESKLFRQRISLFESLTIVTTMKLMKVTRTLTLFFALNGALGFQVARLSTTKYPSTMCKTLSVKMMQQPPNTSSTPVSKTPEDPDPDMSTLAMTREIAALGIPALGGLLIDPLMSLIDTACVGQVSSLQLASMAPCTSIYQFFFVMFFFLSITTTSLVAANPPDADNLDAKEMGRRIDYNERVVSCATLLALACGIMATMALLLFSDPLMTIAGCSSPEMILIGRKYLRIRALGLPLVLVATVLQGASLGRQDAWTPLKIFFCAGAMNLVGDVWLTLQLGWGVTGAAVATLASQVAASAFYGYKSLRLSSRNDKGAVRLTWKGLPDRELVQHFGTMAVSLVLKCVTTMGCYSFMTKAASTMGSLSLAAHQVTLQVWWLLSYFPEPASTAAQSLVARDLKDRPWRVSKLVKVLYGISWLTGGIVAVATGLVLTVPQIARTIVADPAVRALLLTTAGPAMVAQVICSVGSLSDGLAVGCGDFKHLPLNSAIALANLGVALRFTKQRNIAGVWVASSVFFASRVIGHLVFSKKMRGYLFNRQWRGSDLEQFPAKVYHKTS